MNLRGLLPTRGRSASREEQDRYSLIAVAASSTPFRALVIDPGFAGTESLHV
jgi:hypothetical protein